MRFGLWFRLVLLNIVFLNVQATPPACFISCINGFSSRCPDGHKDFSCVCNHQPQIIGCLTDICPYGNFDAARDHFLGTCIERFPPKQQNPSASSSPQNPTLPLYPITPPPPPPQTPPQYDNSHPPRSPQSNPPNPRPNRDYLYNDDYQYEYQDDYGDTFDFDDLDFVPVDDYYDNIVEPKRRTRSRKHGYQARGHPHRIRVKARNQNPVVVRYPSSNRKSTKGDDIIRYNDVFEEPSALKLEKTPIGETRSTISRDQWAKKKNANTKVNKIDRHIADRDFDDDLPFVYDSNSLVLGNEIEQSENQQKQTTKRQEQISSTVVDEISLDNAIQLENLQEDDAVDDDKSHYKVVAKAVSKQSDRIVRNIRRPEGADRISEPMSRNRIKSAAESNHLKVIAKKLADKSKQNLSGFPSSRFSHKKVSEELPEVPSRASSNPI